MEGVRHSFLLAAFLFLTLVVLAASASNGGGDDAAAGAVEEHPPPADEEPYMLVSFHNKDGEEIRLLSDKGTETLSVSGFANRSSHWFYTRDGREGKRRVPKRNNTPSRGSRGTEAEGFWNTLGALANTTAAVSGDPADDERYMLVGMQTSGGDKIRLVVVVADQRYFFITGQAKGFSSCPRWFFRDGDGEHQRFLPLGSNGSSHGGGSHAEVVASNLLAALIKGASGSCAASQ